jgi:hypothetical protein
MRRLKHLAGVERVSVRAVVVKPLGNLAKNIGDLIAESWCGNRRKAGEAGVELMLCIAEKSENIVARWLGERRGRGHG